MQLPVSTSGTVTPWRSIGLLPPSVRVPQPVTSMSPPTGPSSVATVASGMPSALVASCQTATSLSKVLLFQPGWMVMAATSRRSPLPSSRRAPVSTCTWSAVRKSLQWAAVTTKFGRTSVPPQNWAAELFGCDAMSSPTWNGFSSAPAGAPPTMRGRTRLISSAPGTLRVSELIARRLREATRDVTKSRIQLPGASAGCAADGPPVAAASASINAIVSPWERIASYLQIGTRTHRPENERPQETNRQHHLGALIQHYGGMGLKKLLRFQFLSQKSGKANTRKLPRDGDSGHAIYIAASRRPGAGDRVARRIRRPARLTARGGRRRASGGSRRRR